jgi:drug/metabolite transporter (DMT)-like permease
MAVVVRIAANPLSNVAQKLLAGRGVDPAAVIFTSHLLLSACCIPWLPWLQPPAPGFWLPILVSAALAVAANTLITAAMHLSDLSVLGPINAYKAIVSLVPAFVLLGEIPGLAGLAGMGLIVAGSYLLVDPRAVGLRRDDARKPRAVGLRRDDARKPLAALAGDPGVRLRAAAMVLSAVEAVFLKQALAAAAPATTFVGWAVFGLLGAAILRIWRRSTAAGLRAVGRHAGLFAALALTTGLMQYATLVTLTGLQVGYSLALFQTSAVVSVLLGRLFFRETAFLRRLAGSIVMTAGAVLIVLTRK